ncbi:MAG: hypothetical protein QOI61_2595 [Actinomycetota bacterium]|jgi:two-component system response regulator NreC
MTSDLDNSEEGARLSILLVDDRVVVREGLAILLDQQPDFRVVGQLVQPCDAVRLDLEPDVILTEVDFALVGEDARTVSHLRSAFPSSGILVLTSNAEPATIESALADGADGYVLKTSPAAELFGAIRAVGSGHSYLQPSLGVALARWRRQPSQPLLSPREEEVLSLLVSGHTNAGIAERLSTSLRTVETQRASMLQKLGIRTRAELFEYALAAGLINPARSAAP